MLLPQGHTEAVETPGVPRETALCSPACCGDRSLQRCGGWDLSGFRHGCIPLPAQGATTSPSTLTKPQGTVQQTPEPRVLQKRKRSLLSTKHQMAPFQMRLPSVHSVLSSQLICEAAPRPAPASYKPLLPRAAMKVGQTLRVPEKQLLQLTSFWEETAPSSAPPLGSFTVTLSLHSLHCPRSST